MPTRATHFIDIDSLPSHAAREGGGKGAALHRLARAGFRVPRFVILPASASAHIDAVEDAIRARMAWFGGAPIAVRSSALDEDGDGASFAGIHDTFLFVRDADHAVRAVRGVWASASSERALSYRRERNLAPPRGIAVVLQEMIDADASAVVFTCDPVNGDRSRIVVSAALGLGDGLVNGSVDADTFSIDKASGAIVSRSIADKTRRSTGTHLVGVPESERMRPAIDHDTLIKIVDVARRIEETVGAGRPQDIELCVKGGAVYVLQARPVTTAATATSPAGEGRLQLWDNSNIVESYGGLTLPLTFDFARYVYRQVYVQFCEILLVPREQLQGLERFLKNMLGIVHGRIYYNILNWYRLTSILPGFRHNRRFMEQMMGTHHALGDALAEEVRALAPQGSPWQRLRNRVARVIVGLRFAWHHFTIARNVKEFLRNFDAHYATYRKIDWSRLDASAVLEHWYALEAKLLRKWHAPIINDYLCMVHFGILRTLCAKWLPEKGEGFVGELMSGVGDLLSAAPAQELAGIAERIRTTPGAQALLEETDDGDCLEALRRAGLHDIQARVEAFIEQYGHRCMDEMKLEARDLFDDPSFAFACIKNMLRATSAADQLRDKPRDEPRGHERSEDAERQAYAALPAWKRAVLSWSLANARRAVRDREATRLCRTRIYGVVRAMMRAIGADFARMKIIERPDDVFYLRLDEVFGVIDGTLPVSSHARDVADRKREYARYAAMHGAARIETRGAVYKAGGDVNAVAPIAPVGKGALIGTPCAPGVVEGVVRVVRTTEDARNLNGEILVAERTDPGWIPLYPSVSGLLVERGGLLSHSAIVARESGLPTIVGIDGLCARLQTGMRVRMSGDTGHIEILSSSLATRHDECISTGDDAKRAA